MKPQVLTPRLGARSRCMRLRERLKQRECGAQAANRDPHLVHALSIARQTGGLIGQQMT
jgi:hypothetical protein